MKIEDYYNNEGYNDLSEMIVKAQDSFKINVPEDNGWRCQLMDEVIWTPPKGNAPNWFRRKMQELFFGFKWFKLNEN